MNPAKLVLILFAALLIGSFPWIVKTPTKEASSSTGKPSASTPTQETEQRLQKPTVQQPTAEDLKKHPELQAIDKEISQHVIEMINADTPPELTLPEAPSDPEELLQAAGIYGAYETMADNKEIPEDVLKELQDAGLNPSQLILLDSSDESENL